MGTRDRVSAWSQLATAAGREKPPTVTQWPKLRLALQRVTEDNEANEAAFLEAQRGAELRGEALTEALDAAQQALTLMREIPEAVSFERIQSLKNELDAVKIRAMEAEAAEKVARDTLKDSLSNEQIMRDAVRKGVDSLVEMHVFGSMQDARAHLVANLHIPDEALDT